MPKSYKMTYPSSRGDFMLNNVLFVQQSLINHLYYLRSLSSYALNIQLSFFGNESDYITTAKELGEKSTELLEESLPLLKGKYFKEALDYQIFITEYTIPCAKLTESLFDISILVPFTKETLEQQSQEEFVVTPTLIKQVEKLNQEALVLTENFLDFCKHIYTELRSNRLFSYSYPSIFLYMIEDILLYKKELERLISKSGVDPIYIRNYEFFFSDACRQAATFLKSLSDPIQKKVIERAEYFETEFGKLQQEHNTANLNPVEEEALRQRTITLVKEYQTFLKETIQGVLDAKLYFIVEPIFLDTLYTRANYFLYLLEGASYGQVNEKNT